MPRCPRPTAVLAFAGRAFPISFPVNSNSVSTSTLSRRSTSLGTRRLCRLHPISGSTASSHSASFFVMSRPAALLRNAARQARLAPSPCGLQNPLPRAGSSMTKRPLSVLHSSSAPTRPALPTFISSRSFASSSGELRNSTTTTRSLP